GVGRDVAGIDDREIEPVLDRVIEEHRVQHRAGRLADPKGDVRDAENGQYPGEALLDQTDALQGLDPRVRKVVLTRHQREGLNVKDQRVRRESILVDGDV